MVKISVIVPVYNPGEFLEPCLESLRMQTLKDIEIIAIDDASTDDSLKVLECFKKKMSNLRVFKSDYNRGAGAIRNLGISLARGEYIGFVDSDDLVAPHMYEIMYTKAIEAKCPGVISAGLSTIEADTTIDELHYCERPQTFLYNIDKQPYRIYSESPSSCDKIFRRDILEKVRFLEDCKWEDAAFTFSALMLTENLLYIATPLYFYRKFARKNSLTSETLQVHYHLMDVFRVCDELSYFAVAHGKNAQFKSTIKHIQIFICLQRIGEVLKWDISTGEKHTLVTSIYSLMIHKYGKPNTLDKELIKSIPTENYDFEKIKLVSDKTAILTINTQFKRP